MRTLKRATTIKDIAQSLGVSTATVSQALRPNPDSNIKLQEDTVKRVQEEARRLKYRVHTGARSIRAKRFNNIGFFSAKKGKAHSPDALLSGLHDGAEEKGFRVFHIRLTERLDEVKRRLPSILSERNLDALVIGSYHPMSSVIYDQTREDNLPIVYLNDRLDHNCVYVDDVQGAGILTRHLIEAGHRKICFVLRKSPDDPDLEQMHHSAKDRWDGYSRVMHAHGLEPVMRTVFAEEVVDSPHGFPEDWDAVLDQFDSLFAYDDDLANQIGRYAYNHGVHIPDDISLVGYNGDVAAVSAWQKLTTMAIPSYRLGKLGFEMAERLIQTRNTEPMPPVGVVPSLVQGDSVRRKAPLQAI